MAADYLYKPRKQPVSTVRPETDSIFGYLVGGIVGMVLLLIVLVGMMRMSAAPKPEESPRTQPTQDIGPSPNEPSTLAPH